VAIVQLLSQKDVNDQLKPLRDDVADEKLGPFTIEKQLEANPSTPSRTPTTSAELPCATSAAEVTSVPEVIKSWAILGGCLAVTFICVK